MPPEQKYHTKILGIQGGCRVMSKNISWKRRELKLSTMVFGPIKIFFLGYDFSLIT